MSDLPHQHGEHGILNLIHVAIVPDPHAINSAGPCNFVGAGLTVAL